MLLTACQTGDSGAWDELVERYASLVYTIARGMDLTVPEAEDTLYNVFLVVFHSLSKLTREESFVDWLSTATRRETQRILQRRKPVRGPVEPAPVSHQRTAEMVHHLFVHKQIEVAIDQLDPFAREFLLADLSEPAPTDEELAARFSLTLDGVALARACCLAKLQLLLQEMGVSSLD